VPARAWQRTRRCCRRCSAEGKGSLKRQCLCRACAGAVGSASVSTQCHVHSGVLAEQLGGGGWRSSAGSRLDQRACVVLLQSRCDSAVMKWRAA
jgi:hypothetical protein